MNILHRQNRQVQFIERDEHPSQLGLVPRPADQRRHRRFIRSCACSDTHISNTVGPAFVQMSLDRDAIGGRSPEFETFFLVFIRHCLYPFFFLAEKLGLPFTHIYI